MRMLPQGKQKGTGHSSQEPSTSCHSVSTAAAAAAEPLATPSSSRSVAWPRHGGSFTA